MLSNKAMGAAKAVEPAYVEDVFSTYTYIGNNSTQTITNGIDLAGKGGLVWLKNRPSAYGHRLYDTIRTATKFLGTQDANAEATQANGLTAFNANGFSVGSNANENNNAESIVSWTFRQHPKFFETKTFTTTYNVVPSTLTHSLEGPLGMAIFKRTDGTGNWVVWHRSLGTRTYLRLNGTNSAITDSSYAPTYNEATKTFTFYYPMSIPDDRIIVGNAETSNWVGYFFAHNAGGFGLSGNENVVTCGTYTGSAGTTTVNVGFEPQCLLVKRVDSDANWILVDNMRGFFAGPESAGTYSNRLFPNTSDAESVNSSSLYATPTGFTVGPYGSEGGNGGTYIFMAFRRGPMKVPTDGTKVFAPVEFTEIGSNNRQLNSGLIGPDVLFSQQRDGTYLGPNMCYSRMRGIGYLQTNSSASEDTSVGTLYEGVWNQTGITGGAAGSASLNDTSGDTRVNWFFKRAPSFFDEVCYTGSAIESGQNVTHNLKVAPELVIVKRRNTASDIAWWVGTNFTSTQADILRLNQTNAKSASGTYTENNIFRAATTSTTFTVGAYPDVGASGGTFVAYLFATCPGVSKVGSYTGTGTTQAINCGFTAGARFVLIKRTDSTGDWYVWDSARGIVANSDPYLFLNSTAAEVTGTDYIDPSSAGFEISSTAPDAINASGGSFIFLAVA